MPSQSQCSNIFMGFDRWEASATWWQDNFTDGADAEYEEQILPLAAEHLAGHKRVLDIGTGEGQLARAAAAGATIVVGLDPISSQLATGMARGGGPVYLRGNAKALPFIDASFDAAVACLVFEHIDDAGTAIVEVGRILEPGGTFLFFLNHPLLQTPNSGWIDDQILDPPEQYWRVGAYLVEDKTIEEVAKGVHIPFVHRPLSRYVNAMARAGLYITHMDEPAPAVGFIARAPEYAAAATIPRIMVIVARKS